jgi:CheY-like chemotaxis protein
MAANRRPTALLVDDQLVSRKTEQARLEGEGYTVFAAGGQAEALSQARQTSPDVIFVHLASAGGNLPLIQALRSDDSCRHIPVAVIRGNAQPPRTKLRSVPRDAW